MLAALLLVCALVQDKPQDRPQDKPAPDPKRVEQAVAELNAAFAKDQPPQRRVEALSAAVDAPDGRVVALVAKGLEDKEPQVTTAAADSLGRIAHPDALAALHSFARREKKRLAEDEVLYPQVLKAIGRHGSPSSVDLLADDPFSQRAYETIRARLMGLANIRSKRALEAIMEMSKLVGPHRIEGVHPDFRLALARLTGRDLGPDPIAWNTWWQENKKSFEVSPQPPKIDAPLQRQWNRYWNPEKDGEGENGERKDGENGGKGRDGKGRGREGRGGEGRGGESGGSDGGTGRRGG